MSLEKMFSINFESQIWAVFDELKFIFSQNVIFFMSLLIFGQTFN